MVTSIGLSSPATCAAIRGGIAGFKRTRFHVAGEWLRGSPVSLGARGRARWTDMASMAVEECIDAMGADWTTSSPILLCLPESSRPGLAPDLNPSLLVYLREKLGLAPDRKDARRVFLGGRCALAQALSTLPDLLNDGHRAVIAVGVDSFLSAETIEAFVEQHRILAGNNRDGFVPGEGAAAIALVVERPREPEPRLLGLGQGVEPAPIGSDEPLRGTGLAAAMKTALHASRLTFRSIDYRLSDANGEQYAARDGALALAKTMKEPKPSLDVWQPAELVGEIGAAIGPLLLGVALTAARKRYAPGPTVLCHLSSDDGARAALVLGNER